MEQTIPSLDIRKFLNTHLTDVFSTMLSLTANPVASGAWPEFSARVTGSVGLGGEAVNGAVYLHLAADFAQRLASGMLGCEPADASEADVNDVIGELTNMLAGGLKSALCDSGAPCAVSTPAIIRGAAFEIETVPGVQCERLVFECDGNSVAVEVHLKSK